MLVILTFECSLDFLRILLAFCRNDPLRQLRATSVNEVQHLED